MSGTASQGGASPELTLAQDEIRALKWWVKFLRGGLAATKAAGGSSADTGNLGVPGRVQPAAPDSELDSRFGDPTVRKDPKHWAGPPYAGARYSQCPSDYLIVHAESLEYFAEKDSKKPDAKKHNNGKFWWYLNLLDASRARGWARRNKGKDLPPPARGSGADPEDGIVPTGAHGTSDDWEPAE